MEANNIKTIIIGGIAAGMSAAAKLRRLDKEAVIHVYEKGQDLSYGACGMPYYLGGIIDDERSLIARYKEDFEKNDIQIFLKHEVITVIPEIRTISILNIDTNEIISDSYDKLLIATGTSAIRTIVSGSYNSNIYVLNQLSDARKLHLAIKDVKTVAIIGGGYVGVEVAENLASLGIKVHIIERENQILSVYDYDVAKMAQTELENQGVEVHLNESLTSYNSENSRTIVNTDRSNYEVELVIEAIGVHPNTVFLKETGLDMLSNGAIVVNDKMETSIQDIYAAGDCAAYYHIIKEELAYIPLGTHANKTGRIVAENIAGLDSKFPGIVGSYILKVNKLALAKTGIGLAEANKMKLDYDYVDVTTKNQSGYYPGAKEMFIRIVYEKSTGIIKGAQLVGEKGVSDRINIMALAITKNLTAQEFSQLDLAYSPPFSAVWDPLQVATNQIKI